MVIYFFLRQILISFILGGKANICSGKSFFYIKICFSFFFFSNSMDNIIEAWS
jgi:hypothetical protein